jgi:hypothetical protein
MTHGACPSCTEFRAHSEYAGWRSASARDWLSTVQRGGRTSLRPRDSDLVIRDAASRAESPRAPLYDLCRSTAHGSRDSLSRSLAHSRPSDPIHLAGESRTVGSGRSARARRGCHGDGPRSGKTEAAERPRSRIGARCPNPFGGMNFPGRMSWARSVRYWKFQRRVVPTATEKGLANPLPSRTPAPEGSRSLPPSPERGESPGPFSPP